MSLAESQGDWTIHSAAAFWQIAPDFRLIRTGGAFKSFWAAWFPHLSPPQPNQNLQSLLPAEIFHDWEALAHDAACRNSVHVERQPPAGSSRERTWWIQASPAPDTGTIFTATDITPLAQARRTALDRQRRWSQAFEHSSTGVFWLLRSGTHWQFEAINRAARQRLNLSDVPPEGHPIHDLLPETTVRVLERLADRCLSGMQSETCEHTVMHEQELRLLRFNSFPARGSDPVGRVLILVDDITLKRQAEERQQQARHFEAMTRIAGSFAHSFNNLLMAITGNLALLRDANPADQKRFIDNAEAAANQAAQLTRELMHFARPDVSSQTVIDPGKLVREIAVSFQDQLKTPVQFTWEVTPELPLIRGHPKSLRDVILHLCENATEAIEEKARHPQTPEDWQPQIHLEVSSSVIGKNREQLLQAGTYVCIRVRDNGIGMDEKVRTRIFEPFFSTKGRRKGAGLNLANAYRVISRHQGLLQVNSAPHEGAVFTIILPAIPASSSSTPCPVTTAQDRSPIECGGHETILVVDDEPMVRDVAVAILKRAGYQVVEACDGTQAWDLFQKNPDQFQAAMIDVIMPGLSGGDLLHHLKQLRPHLPVIVITGFNDESESENLIRNGAHSLISKPFSPTLMLRSLRRALDQADFIDHP